MEQKMRSTLKAGDRLWLTPADGRGAAAVWEITAVIGEGGSSLCYAAKSGIKSGRLKEFYPVVFDRVPLFARQSDGFLRCGGAAGRALREEFLRAYETLEQIKQTDPAAEILNNFIPPFLLLRGGDEGTVYVWTPDDKQGITFENYLLDAWKKPSKAPEHKLCNILNTILTLTDCIRAFHRAGLLHLDIKPSNFLVLYDSEFNINPGSISLFDINTLCAAGSAARATMGSQGYFAPEVPRGKADNRSDIYSIGAMLFRALANRHYQKSDYTLLDSVVAASDLIRASETNSNVFLRYTLGKILKKCLALRVTERYNCCEELMEDLKRARTFLLPDVVGDQLGLQKKLAILDTEPQDNCSPAAVMHDLLFREPLDTHLRPEEDTIRVLVVGAGTYGQKFMDICLQAGQLLDKKLHITAVSQDPGLDREVYFQVRPSLPEFLEHDNEEGYARLEFRPLKLEQDGTALDELLDGFCKTPLHYVFVSLGNDDRNQRTAQMIAKGAAKRNMRCSINFVVQSREEVQSGGGNPVYINAPLSAKTIDPRLKRMAWNTHLAWADAASGDLKAQRRQFRKKYNLEASLSYALSVSSKLRSVGIYEKDPEKAAAEFAEKILAAPDERYHRLVALEHRRWVLEKVTNGWSLPKNADGSIDLESGIAGGSMKDNVRKTHPCIVKSTAAAPLSGYTKEQWDRPSESDETLDDLDLLSVRQHRLCLTMAQKLRERQPLRQGDLVLIRRRIEGYPAAVTHAFEDYALCLTQILNGSHRAAKQFDRCEAAFRETFSMPSPSLRRELNTRLQQVRVDFFPAVESNLYRDYKRQDEALIRQIPFILTDASALYRNEVRWEEQETLPFEDAEAATYEPKPLDTTDVCLSPELLELTEKIAANIHDVWAEGRLREGWSYGENRDDDTKTTPCLVPYDALPESEKVYDRKTALQTLKFITKLGWQIEKTQKDSP